MGHQVRLIRRKAAGLEFRLRDKALIDPFINPFITDITHISLGEDSITLVGWLCELNNICHF